MHVRFKAPLSRPPWALTFSFGRAIQRPALGIWGGDEAHRVAAQQALLHRVRCNRAAVRGEYDAAMEQAGRPEAAGSATVLTRTRGDGAMRVARPGITGSAIT
jgi:fructose-bisphosphate aldolase class I